MASLEELVVTLVAETDKLRADLNAAAKATSQATNKMDDAIKSFTENSNKNLGFFETSVASMAGFLGSQAVLGVFGLVKDAIGFVADELVKGGEAAIAQEKNLTRLANSLALTGQYSKKALQDLKDFTDQMERETGIADDVVAGNLAVLSSITKLDAEGLKKAEKTAIDLSAAMSIDLDTATRLVGKGIEGNVESFKRYNITVQEGTSKTENLNNIMKALKGTSGAAEGQMKTFEGALKSAENSFGNFFEAIANSIIQNEAFKKALSQVSKIFNEFTNEAEGNQKGLKELAGATLVNVINGFTILATVMDAATKVGRVIYDVLKADFDLIGSAAIAASQILHGDFKGAFETVKSTVVETADTIKKDFNGDTLFGNIATNLIRVGEAAKTGLGEVQKNADGTIAPTVAATAKVHELTAAEKTRRDNLKEMAKGLAEQTTALGAEYTSQSDLLKADLDLQLSTINDNNALKFDAQATYFANRQAQLDEQHAAEDAQLVEAQATRLINAQQYADAKVALERKQNLDSMKLKTDQNNFEKDANKQKLADLQSTFSTIATLSQSSNKTLATIGKAAAITNATIDGYAAVQKALASAPPPFNFALAALVGAATAANVAKIAGVGLATGIDSVPGIGKADNFQATLAPGERVIPTETNKDLTAFLEQANAGGAGGNITIQLSLKDELVEFIEAKILERQRIGVSLIQGVV